MVGISGRCVIGPRSELDRGFRVEVECNDHLSGHTLCISSCPLSPFSMRSLMVSL